MRSITLNKSILLAILFPAYLPLISQQINYCNYFSLEVSAAELNGKVIKSYYPSISYIEKDQFSKFLKKHENRFSYILYNKLEDLDYIVSIYPDTLLLQEAFCSMLMSNTTIIRFFNDLSPKTLASWKQNNVSFSKDEMMAVASKFFYVDNINKSDTTVTGRICVGLNGQDNNQSKDLTLLEAFTFEGIFYYLLKNKAPPFDADFDLCREKSLRLNKLLHLDLDELLSVIRNDCYLQMARNDDLKNKLLKYYKKNRSNLNLQIN